jgi:hypothetical protein
VVKQGRQRLLSGSGKQKVYALVAFAPPEVEMDASISLSNLAFASASLFAKRANKASVSRMALDAATCYAQ